MLIPNEPITMNPYANVEYKEIEINGEKWIILSIVHDFGEPTTGYIMTTMNFGGVLDIIGSSYDNSPVRYEIDDLILDIEKQGAKAKIIEIPEVEI